jgi:rare lipoprotein A
VFQHSVPAIGLALIVSISTCGLAAADALTDPAALASHAANGGAWATTVSSDDDMRAGVLLMPLSSSGFAAAVESRSVEARQSAAAAAVKADGKKHALDGIASYYWQDQKTATGEIFNRRDMTAAHRTLPFGTQVRVTRVDTGASVVVRINDRGPFKPGRVIDLSERAAEDLRMTGRGLVKVTLEVMKP